VQATISKIARATGDFARSEGARLDSELQAKIAPPMAVNEPDKESFIKASRAVYEEFGKQVAGGVELIKIVQSLR
ncbi:MAG TPA: TRAP transporter substrate-binding protein, partial [Burkholderiales bacterium]